MSQQLTTTDDDDADATSRLSLTTAHFRVGAQKFVIISAELLGKLQPVATCNLERGLFNYWTRKATLRDNYNVFVFVALSQGKKL
jgi:hypothetical protein